MCAHTPVRGTVHDRSAMTLTIKNSPELNSPGKPGAPSQNSENKPDYPLVRIPSAWKSASPSGVCRTKRAGLAQPIREEARTVIVFDNGAVLRSTMNLPVGLTVILSNPNRP